MSHAAERTATLVIGWGNELRGDDAAGCRVARAVKYRCLPRVRVMILHQLLPEVAEAISVAERVVFVDASIESDDVEERRVYRADGSRDHGGLGHRMEPARILELAWHLYGASPEAWLVTVPGSMFEVGQPPGPATLRHIEVAETRVLERVTNKEPAHAG